ncbi:MAG: hypothetical protein JST89_11655 [Cyanobacteria bacterium SZAS-4]|nr:hypothetical protein [Cyanobacteria bacterium SZAS-4]
MHNGEVLFKIDKDESVERNSHVEEWFQNGHLFIACGNIIRTRLLVTFLRHKNGKLYIKISQLENPNAEIMALDHSVYLDARSGASLIGFEDTKIRAGLHDIYNVIRMCRAKNRPDEQQKLLTLRKKILRGLADFHKWLVEGIYEASVIDHSVEKKKIDTSKHRVDEEKLRRFTSEWFARAHRTKPIDKNELTISVNELYGMVGLPNPRIVIASNPLIMVIAATFASVLSYKKVNPAADSHTFMAAKQELVGHEFHDMTIKKAFSLREDIIDEATLKAFDEQFQATEGARIGSAHSGTAGDGVNCAIVDASKIIRTDAGLLLDEPNFKLETYLAREVFRCTAAAIDLSDTEWTTNSASGAAETSLIDQVIQTLAGECDRTSQMLIDSICECRQMIKYCNTQELDEFLTNAYAEILGVPVPNPELFAAVHKVWKKCGPIIMHKKFVIASEFPTHFNTDEGGRLHGDGQPSQQWKDGWKLYHWHGVRVSRQFAEEFDTITYNDIESESNLEIRRLMLERYGVKRFLIDVGAQEVQRDECGILYRHTIHEALEPVVMVEVTNSTSEPDGTYKKYFLRVPPHITTAKAGIAWTFNLDNNEYSPIIQT